MWDMVSDIAGLIVLLFLFELMDLPELITNRLRKRISRDELEKKLAEIELRLQKLESSTTDPKS